MSSAIYTLYTSKINRWSYSCAIMTGGNKELDKKLDEVLERLDYLRMVISNLKER